MGPPQLIGIPGADRPPVTGAVIAAPITGA